jgi:hypothetical protein
MSLQNQAMQSIGKFLRPSGLRLKVTAIGARLAATWLWQRSRFVTAGSEVAMTIGALGYLVAFGDMNLLSARVTVEVARLLSAFTGLGGHLALHPLDE